jgi:hypothetical protein
MANRLKFNIKRSMNRRYALLKAREEILQDNFVEIATEMENKRSETSRFDNPIMPENMNSIRKVIYRGMFICSANKAYTFMYSIHSDGDKQNESEYCRNPKICWSLYVKMGRKTHTIWRFHKFSKKILQIVYKRYSTG